VQTETREVRVATRWIAPPLGFLKANWDASIDSKRGRVGVGVVVRDHLGRFWASKCMVREGFLDPMSAEAMGATLAAQFCQELGMEQIKLEGDAKLVIDAVQSRRQDDSNKGHLIADILLVLGTFQQWEMIHVRREGNNVAHRLATFVVHENVNRVWLNDPLECIRDPLQADFSAVHYMN
jgi:ribonuclease HI